MNWKKWLLGASLSLLLVITACGKTDGEQGSNGGADAGKLKVVTSFTIIEDMVREIGGEDVVVYNLVPTGTDPHEYEPLPEDIKKATDADVLFFNGLNLEGGEDGWFAKMIRTVKQKEDRVFSLTERVEPMYIGDEDGHEKEINPHAFIDPAVGVKMAEDLRDALVKVDASREAKYKERAEQYIERLQELDQQFAAKINEIPEENRILVTSERAFQYMAAHYGLKEAFIWEIDTEENGSPAQIKALIEYVKANPVKVLFVESNVDARAMEAVSKETGVRIAGKKIYSDEIGKQGEEVDTYIKYLQYNIELMHSELTK